MKSALRISLLFAAAACGSGAGAADYPAKFVRLIVASTPGGAADVSGRAFAEKLAARWDKPVIVENRPGAGGMVGLVAMTQAAPDGYTLLLNTSAAATFPAMVKAYNLDFAKDVIQVTILVEGRQLFASHPWLPVNTLDELVTYMKNNPGKLNMGQASALGVLQAKYFGAATGTKFEVIQYAGAAQMGTALVAGEVPTLFGMAIGQAKPLADAGRIRLLGIVGPSRDPSLNLPSMSESRHAEVRNVAKSALFAPFWIGPMVPAKTPQDVVAAIYEASREIVRDAEFGKRMRAVNLEPVGNPPSPQESTELLVSAAAEILKIARDAGVQPQ